MAEQFSHNHSNSKILQHIAKILQHIAKILQHIAKQLNRVYQIHPIWRSTQMY